MKDRLTTAPLPLERPQGSCGPCIVRWQEIISPSSYPLARAKRKWNGPWPMKRPSAYYFYVLESKEEENPIG